VILECLDARPLGLSGGQIKDDQITASTTYDSQSVAPAGRLNASAVRRSGGWVAAENDGKQWFQVLLRNKPNNHVQHHCLIKK
jgi:hypothetical protein